MRGQGLQFGAEEEGAVEPAVVERLDAQAVTHQVELSLLAVPEGDAEHADEALQGGSQSPFLDGLEDDFGVRGAAEVVPEWLQFGSHGGVVVGLTVEDDDVALAGREHRLVT